MEQIIGIKIFIGEHRKIICNNVLEMGELSREIKTQCMVYLGEVLLIQMLNYLKLKEEKLDLDMNLGKRFVD